MKKVLLFSDTRTLGRALPASPSLFTKNASVLRISYQLRKLGVDVKVITNFTSFSTYELVSIVNDFSENETKEIVMGVSTSFLMPRPNSYISDIEWEKNDVFIKTNNLHVIAKRFNAPFVIGGFMLSDNNYHNYNYLINFKSDFFVVGDGVDALYRLAKSEKLETVSHRGLTNVYKSKPIDYYQDQASTLNTKDNLIGHSSYTELAAGCVFACSFCEYEFLAKKKDQFMRSYESLYQEIKENYENYGITTYSLTDNTVNDYQPKIEMFLRVKDKLGIDLKWGGYVRLDTLKNKSQVELLKQSGMVSAVMGLESFKKSTGPYIGKMTDGDKLKDLLRMVRDVVGETCLVSISMIAGLPTETQDDLLQTFEYFKSKEGNYLVDSAVFTTLMISENLNKNPINSKRMGGNPWKDYTIPKYGSWVSPWGTTERFDELIGNFLRERIHYYRGFSVPLIANTGMPIEKIIRFGREKNTDFQEVLSLMGKQKEEYKKLVLTKY